jgi:DNA-binding LacI/PurR family transcriptional regulator
VNYAKGIERVVNYLHDLGHRRMAFVSHHRTLGPLSVREQAFRETVSNYSPPIEWKVSVGADGPEGGRQAAREIMASGFDPTAIICVNDFMALGVLHELREAGCRVPHDVSVTGFDNISLAEVSNPSLTTLHIPRERVGQLMFQNLTERSASLEACRRKTFLDPEFMVRESTGPASKK